MAPSRSGAWRQHVALVALGVWVLVSLARLTRLVEPPEVPTGEGVAAFVPFAPETIPEHALYLCVQPVAFGAGSGIGPGLRDELYARPYEDLRAAEEEAAARQ